ncbi:mycofactocin biosynthesis peptidyl-dipeptidase MftE [Nocardioides dubius]|uniref:Mycofactocin biosynthesis peptidyl-dipeptidase MftE n=1 Tax=Nocardioides dubius TaxID=317019 RepID=A0ABP4EQK4_9ACTN
MPGTDRSVLILDDLTWPQVPEDALVLVPIGSTEQHGPHLPLSTDTSVAARAAHAAAELIALGRRDAGRGPVLLAPALPYGASGEHQGFAGTVSIGTEALVVVLIELARSLRLWAGSVVFVNGHGGNVMALSRAVTQLRDEGHDVAWVPCANGHADAHAGHTETSLLLHLAPEKVAVELAEAGDVRPIGEILAELIRSGVRGVSANGVLGDPRTADAEAGRELWQELVADVARRVLGGQGDARGCLTAPAAIGEPAESR